MYSPFLSSCNSSRNRCSTIYVVFQFQLQSNSGKT
uniref:Uncharacterized protein n=1 Tax=Anguilla anguilla TaxID=7936 RepID=A0A0E9Q3Z6_ANGAN